MIYPKVKATSVRNWEGEKKEYGESHHRCRLCLSFSGRLMIHYSWMSVRVEPGFLLPFKSNLNIHSLRLEAAALSVPSSLLNFGLFLYPISKPLHVCFQITPVVYSVRWDQQTRWPLDYHVLHIQMHCLKFSMATPVQVLPKASPNPQSITPTAVRCTRTIALCSLLFLQTCWRHRLVHTQMTTFVFLWSDLQVFVQAAENIYICPAGPTHLQPNQFVSSPNNGACVWQRWMRAQGSS